MAEPNGKATHRSFNCRDLLWEIFERIAKEDGCSVDDLINASMQSYASPRAERTPVPQGVAFKDLPNPIAQRPPYIDPSGRSPSQPSFPAIAAPPAVSPPPLPAPATASPPPLPNARAPQLSMAPTPIPAAPAGAAGWAQMPAPPPWSPPQPSAPPMPPPMTPFEALAAGGASPSASTAPPPVAPPTSGHPPSGPPTSGGLPRLFVTVAGERYQVSKERYVIGRGSRSSDLVIRDPNVSRQHAMIELENGRFYMVDMGSVNGVEHNGSRIARKAIEDGDRFDICGHDVICSRQ